MPISVCVFAVTAAAAPDCWKSNIPFLPVTKVPLVTVKSVYPNRFVPSVPFVPVGGLQAVCAAFGVEKGKPPMHRKQGEFGAFAGASVLPISRTSSGASRASGCPLGATRPFCSFCRRRQKLRFSGGCSSPQKVLRLFGDPIIYGRQPEPTELGNGE